MIYTGGQVLIIHFPKKVSVPLWNVAVTKFANVQPIDDTVRYLQEAGFVVEKGQVLYKTS